MPPQGKAAGQFDDYKFIVFDHIEGMDTQSSRQGLKPNKAAWLENLQPIGPNKLQMVPGPMTALAMISDTIVRQFYANIGNSDYEINFTALGAGNAVNISSGVVTQFAPPNTFNFPDCTQWKSERILIQDIKAGYCTWDGTVFVRQGGASPNFDVTAGGSGYTTAPDVAITGGSGTGVAATAIISGGSVVAIMLTNPGSGYQAGDTLTVAITGGGGSGATATVLVWPFTAAATTLAVYTGRVWMAVGRVINYTGTLGYDDFNPANAAGSTTIPDADLVHSITALRSLNNYLYVMGDNSIKQIGTVTVSGSATNFTIITLSSDQGTTYPDTIQSFNRLLLFANQVGVYAVFGATVQKISDEMDGVFQHIDFTQAPTAALNNINNIRCYLLLVKYNDPQGPTRSIILTFFNKKWFVISQGDNIRSIVTTYSGALVETFSTSGSDLTQIVQNTDNTLPILLRTAMPSDGAPFLGKKAIRVGIAAEARVSLEATVTLDTEYASVPVVAPAMASIMDFDSNVTWANNLNQIVTWENASAEEVDWAAIGFLFPAGQADAIGAFLGVTFSAKSAGAIINTVAIQYQPGPLWAGN